jgi:hypothetical protein
MRMALSIIGPNTVPKLQQSWWLSCNLPCGRSSTATLPALTLQRRQGKPVSVYDEWTMPHPSQHPSTERQAQAPCAATLML